MIYYSVPLERASVPPHVFTDRFWDVREHWFWEGVGTVLGSMVPYFGKVPTDVVGPLEGTPQEWREGLSYDDWVSGRKVLQGRCASFQFDGNAESGSSASATVTTG